MVNFANKQGGIRNDCMSNWRCRKTYWTLPLGNYGGLYAADTIKDQRIELKLGMTRLIDIAGVVERLASMGEETFIGSHIMKGHGN